MQSTLAIHHLYQIKSCMEKEESQLCILTKCSSKFVDFLVYETLSIKRASIPCFNVRNRAQSIEAG